MKSKLAYRLLLALGILFLLCSFVYNTYKHSELHLKKHAQYLSEAIHHDIQEVQKLSQDQVFIEKLHTGNDVFGYLKNTRTNSDINFYIYKGERSLKYWSSNKYNPSNIDFSQYTEHEKLVKINRDYLVLKVFNLDNDYQLVTLITLYKGFHVENKYLKSGFSFDSRNFSDLMLIEEEDTTTYSVPVLSSSQQVLFYIKNNRSNEQTPLWTIIIIELLGLFFIFLAIEQQLNRAISRKKTTQAILITLIYITFIELYVHILQIPSFTTFGNPFKPDSYASHYLANSLGGLLISLYLIHWLIRHWLGYIIEWVASKNRLLKDVLVVTLSVSAFYLVIYIAASLHKNSNILLELNKINQLGKNSFIAIFVLCFCVGILSMFTKYLKDINLKIPTYLIVQIVFHIGFIFIGYKFGFIFGKAFVLTLFILYFAYNLLLWFLYPKVGHPVKNPLISNLLLLSIYSLIVSVALIHYSDIRQSNILQYYAVNLASERDYAEEFEMGLIADSIQTDNFIKSYLENPAITSFDIDWRIRQKYFSDLSNKYDITVLSYNPEKIQLKGEENRTYFLLYENIQQDEVERINSNVFYMNAKPKGEKYTMMFEYRQKDEILGYLFIIFIPKSFTTYSAYPELLTIDNNILFNTYNSDFSYAIYSKSTLISTAGDYSYSDNYNFPSLTESEVLKIKGKGFNHIIYKSDNKSVVVSYTQTSLIVFLSYCSLMLIILLVFFYFLSLISENEVFMLSGKRIKKLLLMNTFQKQIQVSMLSQVFFSLILVGLMTLFFFDIQYNRFHNDSLKRRGNSVVESIESIYEENFNPEDTYILDQTIHNKIKQLADIFKIDINVYGLDGKLEFSSMNEIFKLGIQSNLMNPKAFAALKIDGLSNFIQNEKIEKLKYTAAYLPVKDSKGKVIYYVNFPYYGKERNVKNDISFFLVSLINIYVLLIILSTLISLWVSNAIVNPLKIITESISSVSLDKKNQHIAWKNKDEIGQLVSQYNQMIDVLADSAELLAKSEREGAWREMAKQVAHEIKNPLTPMKLSVQLLQRKLREGSEDLEDITENVSQRIIEQIDTLANIATAFSDFAKMPFANKSNENIISILTNVIGLFDSDDTVTIQTHIPFGEVLCYVDKNQMTRVFTNLIKNAIQSIPENREAVLKVDVSMKEDSCIVAIQDNGIGIPKEREKDIFEPNFTTKSSGSGLGLAMSKSIIETMGGEIWFESEPEQGTTFFIQLKCI